MLPALIIVFREGFEAFLSVAIILTYLRKTGRDWLRPAVHAGIIASLVVNPVIVGAVGEGAVIVDALVERAGKGASA